MNSVYRQNIKKEKTINVPKQVNRIYVIDCSGSMYGVMPYMKDQIKNKIPQLTNTGDTVSIVWFSSKGESGILLEGIEVNSITDFMWFKEFSSMDENSMIIKRNGKEFSCEVEVKDIEIEI